MIIGLAINHLAQLTICFRQRAFYLHSAFSKCSLDASERTEPCSVWICTMLRRVRMGAKNR